LIEDNPGDARLIQEMLSEENFAVENIERFDRLSTGLKRLAEGGIDAVLLDLGLPDSHGLNTFEKVHSAAHQVPILILTGFKDDAQAVEAVRRGAQDYLSKGRFDGPLLVRAITYAIERKKLDEAVQRQAALIDLSPDAIIVKKPDDTITFWSLGAEKVYGYTKDEALGKKTLSLIKTKFSQPFETIDVRLKKEGKWSGELCHETKFGRELSIQSYWLAKFDENCEISEIFESNVDITERKNAERLAAIGATAGMVGHDIRNPLQTITGEVYLAKIALKDLAESESKVAIKESLDVIEHQTDYVNKIVQDLQDFAKPIKPIIKEIDLDKVCEELLSKTNVPENVEVSCQIQPDAKKLSSDPDILKRILVNLVTNAVQAMPKGGKLCIGAYQNGSDTVLTVDDTGCGIPKDASTKLFTPLFTTKAKGQGFGLAVVKRMTEALGGTVTFESEQGKGTKFILRLPPQTKK
jgi:PAS domain S-box-containing protein